MQAREHDEHDVHGEFKTVDGLCPVICFPVFLHRAVGPCSGTQGCEGLQMYGLEKKWMVGKPSLGKKPGPRLSSWHQHIQKALCADRNK